MDSLELILCVLTGVLVAGAAYANLGNYSALIDFVERDLRDRLRSLRALTPHLRRWINIWLALVAAIFFILWLGFEMLPTGMLVAALLCAGPWYIVRRLATTRRQKIEDQLADAMVMFSSAVRAGLSIAQSLELLADDCPKPINQEFKQIVGEYQLGKPLERTLTEAKERLQSENFVLFTAALLASRESGGRLNETVERISKSVLELQRLERKVMSETAQARKSAVYMILILPIILLAYAFMAPEEVAQFQTLPGQIILAIAVILTLIAYVWALRIIRTEI